MEPPSTLVLRSAQHIATTSKHVSVCEGGVRKAASFLLSALNGAKYDLSDWKRHPLNPKVADDHALEWIFVVDTLNFSFWTETDTQPWTVEYNNQLYTGYWALCAALNRAHSEGIPIFDASYYANITRDELSHIFRSSTSTPVPLLDTRLRHLHEVGSVLVEKYGERFSNLVKTCEGSAQTLLQLIIDNFPCYRDTSTYQGQKVWFLKRAQILVADIWACSEGRGLGAFSDIDTITMFADYRVPQILAHLGAIKYSDTLSEKLKNGEILAAGCEEEIEIRGCSIWSVERIRVEVERMVGEKRRCGGGLGLGNGGDMTEEGGDVKEEGGDMREENGDVTEEGGDMREEGGDIREEGGDMREDGGERRREGKDTREEGGVGLNAVTIDFYLWDYAKAQWKVMEHVPIHRIRTPFY